MSILTLFEKILSFFNPRKLDNKGGLLIPISLKISDVDFFKYRQYPLNLLINDVKNEDLPEDFSRKSINLINVFRKKTIDLEHEVMLVFDYISSQIIYCFVNDDGDGDEVTGIVDEDILIGKNIAIIHNHPFGYGSPPSDENFQIFSLPFQDYEILSSWDGIWIVESKELIPDDIINDIKTNIRYLKDYSSEISERHHMDADEIIRMDDELYGKLLLEYINNYPLNIKLTKNEL